MTRLSFKKFAEIFGTGKRVIMVDDNNPHMSAAYIFYRFGYQMGYLAGKKKSNGEG